MIRSICAFLNSRGGLLVWGAPRGTRISGKNEHSVVGGLCPISSALTKDQVISKIVDSIAPLPDAVRIKIIQHETGDCVCVFDIDESIYSPHQTREGVYYMRIDGQTKPAPHHYVEALFRKIRFPKLEGFLRVNNVDFKQMQNHFYIGLELFFFNWSEMENVQELSFMITADHGEFFETSTRELRRPSVHKVLHFGQPYSHRAALIVGRPLPAEKDFPVKLFLFFGAKNTPSKISEYEINLSGFHIVRDGETYVTSRRENILFKDLQSSLGITREKTLEKVLGRKS